MHTDLVVVGAGPVGLATAIQAAGVGLRVVVLDRRTPPLDKACGEGVMPLGVAALARLGIDPTRLGGVPFDGIRFVDGDVVAQAAFADGSGLGLRRTVLSAALLARAGALGVTLRTGTALAGFDDDGRRVRVTTARESIQARWLIGADGLHSGIRRTLGLERPPRGRSRYGIRRHFAVAPWASCVEVHWSDGAEAYVTPVAPDTVGVAVLWSGGGSFGSLVERFPTLRARLGDAPPRTPARGAGPLRQRVRRRWRGRIALVGDAAGYLDPLTGEGLTLGLRTAEALVATLAAERPLHEYERRHRRLTRATHWTTEALLAVAARPALRRRLVAAFASDSRLFARFLAVGSGALPLSAIGPTTAGRLLRRIAWTASPPAPPRLDWLPGDPHGA